MVLGSSPVAVTSKIFDIVNHHRLLTKLEQYEIKIACLRSFWFHFVLILSIVYDDLYVKNFLKVFFESQQVFYKHNQLCQCHLFNESEDEQLNVFIKIQTEVKAEVHIFPENYNKVCNT